MEDAAGEQVRDGREPDVRMGPYVHALAGRQRHRPEVIEEDERADGLAAVGGQHPPDGERAEVADVGAEQFGCRRHGSGSPGNATATTVTHRRRSGVCPGER